MIRRRLPVHALRWPSSAVARRDRRKRGAIVGLLVLVVASGARADGETLPELRVRPGAGAGISSLSLELNVERGRWYGGAQLALAGMTNRAAIVAYAGVRAGTFLTDGATTPFFGVGIGALTEGEPYSEGWGASAELGVAFRRDQRWFHPQLVLQGIVPFAQHTTGSTPPEPARIFFLGVRLFL